MGVMGLGLNASIALTCEPLTKTKLLGDVVFYFWWNKGLVETT